LKDYEKHEKLTRCEFCGAELMISGSFAFCPNAHVEVEDDKERLRIPVSNGSTAVGRIAKRTNGNIAFFPYAKKYDVAVPMGGLDV
jgi:hypothetical protein